MSAVIEMGRHRVTGPPPTQEVLAPVQSQLIPLRNRQGLTVAFARVDAEDYEWLSQWRWSLSGPGYVQRATGRAGYRQGFYLHRVILGLERGDKRRADHINFDKLDNRRCNLRIVTHARNNRHRRANRVGTSRYRGVSWDKREKKWKAYAGFEHQPHHLGLFDTELEAAEVVRAFWRERGFDEWFEAER